jgi:hypothetical protein
MFGETVRKLTKSRQFPQKRPRFPQFAPEKRPQRKVRKNAKTSNTEALYELIDWASSASKTFVQDTVWGGFFKIA